MSERKSFLLRIDPRLFSAIEAMARQEFRSVNGQIEFLLRNAVRASGRQTPAGADDRGPGSDPKAAHPPAEDGNA